MNWKNDPITQLQHEWIERKRESLKEDWAQGSFIGPDFQQLAIRNAGAVGYANACNEIMELDLQQIEEMGDE